MAGGGSDASLTDNDFKNFIISNGVVTAAVAITIGIATASFIKAIVSDLMMPGFYIVFGNYILQHVSAQAFKKMTQLFEDRSIINLDAFFKEFISWIFIILGSYILLNFIVNKWFLGNNSVLSPAPNVNPIPYYASTFPMV
jgi:large-conductance mechanosensitive channel